MKVKKFLKNIEDFFKSHKKEEILLEEALLKLEAKRLKLFDKIKKEDYKEEDRESLEEKLKMVEELEKKIEKKLNKLNSKKSIE